jgi:hypothetical protein
MFGLTDFIHKPLALFCYPVDTLVSVSDPGNLDGFLEGAFERVT